MNPLPGDSNLAAGLRQRDIDAGDSQKYERALERALERTERRRDAEIERELDRVSSRTSEVPNLPTCEPLGGPSDSHTYEPQPGSARAWPIPGAPFDEPFSMDANTAAEYAERPRSAAGRQTI